MSKKDKPVLITEVNDNLDGTGSSIQEINQHEIGEEQKRHELDEQADTKSDDEKENSVK